MIFQDKPSWYEMSQRDLNHIFIERDISETSQKKFKRDDFFVTSLRHLKNISKGVFCVTSVRISKKCLFRDVSETSQKHLPQVFVIFQKYPTKMFSYDFRWVTEISDKIDVGQLETLKK